MKLTEVSITRPLAILMAIIALVLVGGVAHQRLAVDLLPNVSIPEVSVSILFPGASPTDVETLVTKPVEDTLSGLPHVVHVNSTSSEGNSSVNVQFADGTDVSLAAIDVERAVTSLKARLPADAQSPVVQKFDTASTPILFITFSGSRPLDQLYNLVNDTVKDRLEAVDGVAAVAIFGGLPREINIQVDPAMLRAHHVTLGQVIQALQATNQTQPVGAIEQGASRYEFRVVGEVKTPQELGQVVIPGSGAPVHIGDVATIADTFVTQTFLARTNGRDSVAMAIYKQSTANSVTVADNVKKAIAQLQPSLPEGTTFGVLFDSSLTTKQSLADVNQNLIAAVILTGVVLLFFLHNIRSTFIVLLAIPTSLISTYAVMYVLGFTLNMLSLMALALLIGILVDDSIVVLENITRHIELGEKPRSAALVGRSEIGLAAIAITFVDVVVYTPVAFMSGTIGAFFRQFGLTITAATLFSLLISFTLTPMLASRWLKHNPRHGRSLWARFGRLWDSGIAGLSNRYATTVGWAIDRAWGRWLVVGIAILALVGSFALVPLRFIGTEFVPQADGGLISVNVELPPGTALAGTAAVVEQVAGDVRALPEVDSALSLVGTGGRGAGSQARFGSIFVQLKPKAQRHRSDSQLARLIQDHAKNIPGAKITAVAAGFGGGGEGGAISYDITGPDLQVLSQQGDKIAAIIAGVPGTKNVVNNGAANLPEIRIQVDQTKLADAGLTTSDVASTVRTALQGTVATQYQPPSGTQVDVRVQLDPAYRVDSSQVLRLPLTAANGNEITLEQIATIVTTTGPNQVTRYDRQRRINVSGDLDGSRALGQVTQDVQAQLKQLQLAPGYKIVTQGSASDQAEAFTSLLQALAFSVILMYMLMVALYESLVTPFVVMFSLPMAIIGALIALALTHNTLNIFSMIGLIMLLGLVAKNAILLVDYTNTLRARGMERSAALREAGRTRLRPILMTTTSMVLAMLPLALKIGQGSELRSSMGVVLIGGLLSSLLLTLILVPVVYAQTENNLRMFGRFFSWIGHIFRRSPEVEALPEPVTLVPAANDGATGFNGSGHTPEPSLPTSRIARLRLPDRTKE